MTAILFAGPSLPPKFRSADPDIAWRPPLGQGDLYRAALSRPAIIGVVDGYFETVPTVWHKEILWAMSHGIHVYGAASIGALRAAELAAFGMQGVGRIYEDFRDGILQDDDEVALLHGPAELGYPPVTEAMVNIRASLAAAVAAGILAPALAARLTETAKALFYKQRSYAAILRAAARDGMPAKSLSDLEAWLPAGQIDQKRRDAVAMLEVILAHLGAGPEPLLVSFRFAATAAWRTVRETGTPGGSTPAGSLDNH